MGDGPPWVEQRSICTSGASTPVVLPAHPEQSQHDWTRAPRNSSDPQPPHKASPPQHVPSHGTSPSHGMSASPWQDGADMGRKCSACFSPQHHKDVSYNTQKRGLTGDQHTTSLLVLSFGYFFPLFPSLLSCLLSLPADVCGTAGHSSTSVQRKCS